MLKSAVLFAVILTSAKFNVLTDAAVTPMNSTCIKGAFTTKLDQEQIDKAVAAHNNKRRDDGADQLKMTWDNDLAALAQEWADASLCVLGHNMIYDCTGKSVGQNAFWSRGMALNMTAAVEKWASEKADYDLTSMSCATDKVCGHWTQVVWSRSTKVGCGYSKCGDDIVVICDYSIAGNMGGEEPFIKGPSCSACRHYSDALPGSKCVDGFCEPCSPAADSTCKCSVTPTCLNGGQVNSNTCQCDCVKGTNYGPTCADECKYNGGWTAENCAAYANRCIGTSLSAFLARNCAPSCPYCQ